jgi:hypothetical protein
MANAPQRHSIKPIGKQHAAKHKTQEARGNSTERGYDHRWAKFRLAFLMANPLCEYCAADGRVEPATVCDHDEPARDLPNHYATTFTALCGRHHRGEKARVEARLSGESLLAWVRRRKSRQGAMGRL